MDFLSTRLVRPQGVSKCELLCDRREDAAAGAGNGDRGQAMTDDPNSAKTKRPQQVYTLLVERVPDTHVVGG